MRGFSLNARGPQQLNLELLKENVIHEVTAPQEKPRDTCLQPAQDAKRLETFTEIKRYRLVFDKRVVVTRNFVSYPYGYLRPDPVAEEMERELSTLWDEQDDVNVERLRQL